MARRKHKVFRGGKVHVGAAMCPTCIFGPNSPVDTERTRAMLAQDVAEDCITPCHEWMDTKTPIVCRGLFETRRVAILQIAERMGVVQFDDLGPGPGYEDRG